MPYFLKPRKLTLNDLSHLAVTIVEYLMVVSESI